MCSTKDLGTSAQRPKPVSSGESKFWSILGGRLEPLKELSVDPDEDDEEYESSQVQEDRVWHLVNVSGNDTLQPLVAEWGRPPSQSILKSDEVFVFEFGDEVYYWMGAQVPFPKRRSSLKLIKKLWEQFDRRNMGLNLSISESN